MMMKEYNKALRWLGKGGIHMYNRRRNMIRYC